MGICGIYVRTSIEKENTSIEQQINEGVKFCKKNKFKYQIYDDIGKSGFKIENRPKFLKLIDDIENGIIDKIWVFEHSRFSREPEISIILYKTIKKQSVIVYQRDKLFDINDPQTEMFMGMSDVVSRFEGRMIKLRTTRGLHDSINRGIRGYNEFYGYKKEGKRNDGYMKWSPVESEIENIKYSYHQFLKGSSIKSIVTDIYKNKITEKNRSTLVHKWSRILRHFENTGFSLNIEGLEIFNKFKKCEIDSIRELNDKKYYVKSFHFPIKIVSIETWIKVVEKLQVHKQVYKNRMRRIETEMLTGIILCPVCDLRFYYVLDKGFKYYKHYPKKSCTQKPKSIRIEKLNRLIEVFYFYFFLVYDDTKVLIEENQKILKLNVLEIRDKIKNIETETKRYVKQIENFQDIYEKSDDTDLIKLSLIKENDLTKKKERNEETITKLKVELELLNQKYDQDELELTYYDVKETIINFFEKLTVEERRMSIVKIIKFCQIFGIFLIIDTGNVLFIFNTEEENILPEEIYSNFKKDKNFKDNFLNSSLYINKDGYRTRKGQKIIKEDYDKFIEDYSNYINSRYLGNKQIHEYFLKKNVIMKTEMEKRLQKLGIQYSLFHIEKIVSFTEEF